MNQTLHARRDLSYLSIGYFVFAGFWGLSVRRMAGVVWLVSSIGPPDNALFHPFSIVIRFMLGLMVLQIACGAFIRRRRFRSFCIVVGICNCFAHPLGAILGIFTMMLLNRPDVLEDYEALNGSEAHRSPTNPPNP